MSTEATTAAPTGTLPEQFRDLEWLGDWILTTEKERSAKRLSTPYPEIEKVYNALLPRLDEILAYLNGFPLDAMPEAEDRLLTLTFVLAEVAPAVEFFGQPSVIGGFDPERFTIYQ
jgi:hypothetical protein